MTNTVQYRSRKQYKKDQALGNRERHRALSFDSKELVAAGAIVETKSVVDHDFKPERLVLSTIASKHFVIHKISIEYNKPLPGKLFNPAMPMFRFNEVKLGEIISIESINVSDTATRFMAALFGPE